LHALPGHCCLLATAAAGPSPLQVPVAGMGEGARAGCDALRGVVLAVLVSSGSTVSSQVAAVQFLQLRQLWMGR
jgi:hypothetical protein